MKTDTNQNNTSPGEEYVGILRKELEARILMMEKILCINGYEVNRKEDKLHIRHPNGFTKVVTFSISQMEDVFYRGAADAIEKKIAHELGLENGSLSDSKEITRVYTDGGTSALKRDRSDFIQRYYRVIQRETREQLLGNTRGMQISSKAVVSPGSPEKNEPGPEM